MFVVPLLFGPGSGPQVNAWPAVFSCGLGVLLYTCSEFYSSQHFLWCGWFIAFCRAFLSLPSLPVVLLCYCLGLALVLLLTGLWVGQAARLMGCSTYLGFGWWLLGTQPPFAT